MRFRLPERHNTVFISCVLVLLITGCSPPGSVVNHARFETVLTQMKLVDYPQLKVYYGGSLMNIPLQDVKSIIITPTEVIQFENELYSRAEISLKDGSSIVSTEKDTSSRTTTFICIQNTLTGKHSGDKFRISLSDIARIEVR